MKKSKKKMLGLWAIGITAAIPIATVISCSSNQQNHKNKLQIPVDPKGSLGGVNFYGTYVAKEINGTKIKYEYLNDHNGSLENGDIIKVDYSLLPGMVWNNGTKEDVSLRYEVKGLSNHVKAPTIVKGNLSGYDFHGTFVAKPVIGTSISYSYSADGQGTLKNEDFIFVKYTLKNGLSWSDNTRNPITLKYVVHNLPAKVDIPTNPYGRLSGSQGSGTYIAKRVDGTSITYSYSSHENGTLKNGDIVTINYHLLPDMVWTNGTKEDVSLTYQVSGLTPK